MTAVVRHPAVAEFEARVNANTIVEREAAHKEELRRLHETNGTLAKQNRLLTMAMHEMQTAVIEINGKRLTIWSLYESGKFEQLCHCRNVDCEGCPITDPADRETWESGR